MAEFAALHLSPAHRRGGRPPGLDCRRSGHARRRATVARGHNLVALLPPVPAAATPVLAGLLSRLGGGTTRDAAGRGGRPRRVGRTAPSARGGDVAPPSRRQKTGRAARRCGPSAGVDLLVCSPETALALHLEAPLRPETLSSVALAWPEDWGDGEALAEVMQDVPKDAQRIVLGSSGEDVAEVVERYARRALTVSAPGLAEPSAPAGPVRTLSVPWSRRVAALPELIELLDPVSVAIWTLDQGHVAAIRQSVMADHAIEVDNGRCLARASRHRVRSTDAAAASSAPGRRRRRHPDSGRGRDLHPAHRCAPPSTPSVGSALDAATSAAEARRATIADMMEKGSLDRALLTLAPLLERYDAAAVAAALFELWSVGGSLLRHP